MLHWDNSSAHYGAVLTTGEVAATVVPVLWQAWGAGGV